MTKILLYGAYGYTGRLILDELLQNRLPRPLVAGRNESAIAEVADLHRLDFAVATAEKFEEILAKHPSIELVINAAGPFIHTAKPIAEACIENAVHYIDVSGEIESFRLVHDLGEKAKKKGVMLLPGTGFDVAPTDCLANRLKGMLPDATHLNMAFAQVGAGASRGTTISALNGIKSTTLVRRNGALQAIPWTEMIEEINFGAFKRTCVPIPWGDLFTAFISTQIPNIQVFMPMKSNRIKKLYWVGKLLSISFLKQLIESRMRRKLTGPTSAERETSVTHVVGWASNAGGEIRKLRLELPNGYSFTANCTVWVAQSVLNGKFTPGFQTPAMAYGDNFIAALKDVRWVKVG